MKILEGKLLAEGQRIGIVAGRFNEFITAKLLGGAVDAFVRHGGDENNLEVAWVPGAFEIPLVAKKMAESKNTMLLSVWGLLSAGQPLILIWWLRRLRKEWHKQVYKPEYQSFLVY